MSTEDAEAEWNSLKNKFGLPTTPFDSSASHLQNIINGYYPVIVSEPDSDGYSEWYHVEWVSQKAVINNRVHGLICPWKLLLPVLIFFRGK